MDGAARPRGADTISGCIAVTSQHENILPQRLNVIGNEITRNVSFIVQTR